MSYYLLVKLRVQVQIAVVGLNICRITFWSNSHGFRPCRVGFEYMSYYLLVKLFKTTGMEIWV